MQIVGNVIFSVEHTGLLPSTQDGCWFIPIGYTAGWGRIVVGVIGI
jgi:hypothetical protein